MRQRRDGEGGTRRVPLRFGAVPAPRTASSSFPAMNGGMSGGGGGTRAWRRTISSRSMDTFGNTGGNGWAGVRRALRPPPGGKGGNLEEREAGGRAHDELREPPVALGVRVVPVVIEVPELEPWVASGWAGGWVAPAGSARGGEGGFGEGSNAAGGGGRARAPGVSASISGRNAVRAEMTTVSYHIPIWRGAGGGLFAPSVTRCGGACARAPPFGAGRRVEAAGPHVCEPLLRVSLDEGLPVGHSGVKFVQRPAANRGGGGGGATLRRASRGARAAGAGLRRLRGCGGAHQWSCQLTMMIVIAGLWMSRRRTWNAIPPAQRRGSSERVACATRQLGREWKRGRALAAGTNRRGLEARTMSSIDASQWGFPPSLTANSMRMTSRFLGTDCQRHWEKCMEPVAASAPLRYLKGGRRNGASTRVSVRGGEGRARRPCRERARRGPRDARRRVRGVRGARGAREGPAHALSGWGQAALSQS